MVLDFFVPDTPAPAPALPKSDPLIVIGRVAFAAALAFWGVQQLHYGAFVTRAMPAWPDATPFHTLGPYLVGAIFLLAAAAILLRRQARRAALLVATLVLLGFFLVALPNVFDDALLGGAWTNAGKAFWIAVGALVVATSFSVEPDSPTDRLFLVLGRIALGGFMIQSGVQHFLWDDFVHTLVPTWIPGGPFWTYFSGVALIAGGIGLLLPRTARLAALLSGAMVLAWVLLLHLPRALLTVRDANEATALFEAIAFSGLAFLLAAKLAPAPVSPRSTASPPPPAS